MATKPALAQATDDDDPPLTKRELALLKSRVDDFDDPTRFVIVSPFSRRFCLYYAPGDGVSINYEPRGTRVPFQAQGGSPGGGQGPA